MAVSTTDVVAPVFAAAEVVVLFSPGMAAQTRFGDLFRRLVLERDDLGGIAFLRVGLAWSMTRLTACHSVFPALQTPKLGVRGRQEILELIFVTVFARLTADVLILTRRDFVVIGSAGGGEIARDRPET